jgi:hypothetical protein
MRGKEMRLINMLGLISSFLLFASVMAAAQQAAPAPSQDAVFQTGEYYPLLVWKSGVLSASLPDKSSDGELKFVFRGRSDKGVVHAAIVTKYANVDLSSYLRDLPLPMPDRTTIRLKPPQDLRLSDVSLNVPFFRRDTDGGMACMTFVMLIRHAKVVHYHAVDGLPGTCDR